MNAVMPDIIIKNGTVIFENMVKKVDLLIRQEKIAAIFAPGQYNGPEEVLDAAGLHIFPGTIDPHMHMGLYKGLAREFLHDTPAQAIGGVTTIVSYHRGKGDYFTTLPKAVETAEANSAIDFAFSLGLCQKIHMQQLERFAAELGVTSFKFFFDKQDIAHIFYDIPKEEALTLDKADLYFSLKKLAEIDPKMLLCVHCEDPDIFRALQEQVKHSDMDKKTLKSFNATRPDFVETVCALGAVYLNSVVSGNLYIVHTSSASTIKAYEAMIPVFGGQVTIETCPQYLLLDQDYSRGLEAMVNPPVRCGEDRDILWEAIRNGVVKTIGSDNNPVDRGKKFERGDDLFSAFPGFGGPGLILPTLISEGYHKRKIPLPALAKVNSIQAGRIFNLPGKGNIDVGFDADLALVDLNWEREITEELFGFNDFCVYAGMKLKGWPKYTISRGAVIVKNGAYCGKAGHGKYIRRSI